MKVTRLVLLVLSCWIILLNSSFAEPIGTAFTYQGQLYDDGSPAEGLYDLQFKLFDDSNVTAAVQVGYTLVFDDHQVSNGNFNVALDFGTGVFQGQKRWIEIAVRPYDLTDVGDFVTLSPRNEIMPVPYAMASSEVTGRVRTPGIYETTANIHAGWSAKDSVRNWSSVAMSADGMLQTAVDFGIHLVSPGHIYVSTDMGDTWTAKESPRYWKSVAMSSDGSTQTAVVNNGQIYVSRDTGNTWTAKESNRIWNSVAMSSDGTIQTACEDNGRIYVSIDTGNTWTPGESVRYWRSVAMSADGSIQAAADSLGQVYISKNFGDTWTPKGPSRSWRSVAMSADGSRIIAVFYGEGQIYVSTDTGNTWTAKGPNQYWSDVAISDNGKSIIACDEGPLPIIIPPGGALPEGGRIYVSTDYGNSWQAQESVRVWNSVAMSSAGNVRTAAEWGGQIYTYYDISVPSVGIGTNSPQEMLDVAATVKAKAFVGDGSGLTNVSIDLTETDPTVPDSIKDGISWYELSNIPSGFADNRDDSGITSETDPTVLASVKDGVSWLEVSGKPKGFSDGIDDVGITTETDPTVPAGIKDGISWSELSGLPKGFSDGIDDVGITTETDPTVAASVKDGVSWLEIANRPSGLDNGDDVGITSESDPTVAASVKDGVSWSELSGLPKGFADAIDNIGVDGLGSAGYIPIFTDITMLGNSAVFQSGSSIGIGTTTPSYPLDLNSTINGMSARVSRGNNLHGGIRWDEKGAADAQWLFPYFRGWQGNNLIVREETADIDVMTFEFGTGNVGINTGGSPPRARLDVNGDIHASGEIEKEYSGNLHPAGPIAYGSIKADGKIESGTGNFTCSWDGAGSRYLVAIDGQSYKPEYYAVSLTPYNTASTSITGQTGTGPGSEMSVNFKSGGIDIQTNFQFIVYKP